MRCAGAFMPIAALASACVASAPPPPSAPSPLLAQTVPEFVRPALDGSRIDTAAARGRVLVVRFFANYCEPCMRTLPALERLHEDHPEVAIVGVDESDAASDAALLVSTYGLRFPVMHDAGNVLAGRFRVGEIPTMFVVDRDGVVRWVGGEARAELDLERVVTSIVR